MNRNKVAILLHGILRSNLDMMPLKNRLKKAGYTECLNIKYPSTKHTLEELTEIIHEQISQNETIKNGAQLDFVTHSMGGLLARYYITTHRPQNMGTVVMLGTPNQGSEMADFLSENKILAPVFHSIFGPASHQLKTGVEHFPEEQIDYPLGIIASNLSINPIGNFIFGKPNDSLVTIDSTKIDGMTDHITITSTHSVMMFDPRIMDQVVYFLENRKFNHKGPTQENQLDL